MTTALNAWQKGWGYTFQNPQNLRLALTHPSRTQASGGPNYQRLEFLGDRVIGLVVAHMLMESFPDAPEGDLARRHAALVSTAQMAHVAGLWGVAPHIILGTGEEASGGASKPAILADVVEALMGAVFQESGLPEAERLIRATWAPLLLTTDGRDPKTLLQEHLQTHQHPLPVYQTREETGPAHQKHFRVQVTTALGQAEGEGASKQKASSQAAANLLKVLNDDR